MDLRRRQHNSRSRTTSCVVMCFAVLFAILTLVIAISILASMQMWLEDLPSINNMESYTNGAKTTIYANDKKTILAEFYLEDRQPVTTDQISKYVLEGTVATEDVRFYEHNGIDPSGIARAIVNNFFSKELEGASTITQQLVRNTLLADEASSISLKRKIREAERALQVEKKYSKDRILTMYLNTINYGDGCYGIEAAAQHYFQVSAKDLSIVQAATLIGIPQSPTYNNPVNFPENCKARRNTVLNRMLTYGCITQEEYQDAIKEPLELDLAEPKPGDGIYQFPYFTSYVRDTLLDQLSYDKVFSGGLTVYTTLNPTLQEYAEQATNEVFDTLDSDISMALTCVDPNTGYILAMVGGRDYYSKQYNMATSESGRQAGSSFKPFTLAAAIEQGINPKANVDCSSPVTINGWKVENYNNYSYGTRSIESATWVSSNTGYARLVTDANGVSPSSVLSMAARLGVTGKNGFGAYPSITLGVAQVNTTKMAGAYATFAANGKHYETTCIQEVKDNNNKTIINNTNPKGTQVLSNEVAGAVTSVLQGVVTQGTATDARLGNGQVSAGKTGTSENHRDLWYCGYTPQYSCAVWAGADPEREMYEANWCKTVWRKFITLALGGMEIKKFDVFGTPAYESDFNPSHGISKRPAQSKADAYNYNSSNTNTDTSRNIDDDYYYSENTETDDTSNTNENTNNTSNIGDDDN